MNDFNEIYSQYFKDVYRYALFLKKNEAIAEEVTQETFFKALKGIAKFDGRYRLIRKGLWAFVFWYEKSDCSYNHL